MARTNATRCVNLYSIVWKNWTCPECNRKMYTWHDVWYDRKGKRYVCAKCASKLNKEQEDNNGK